MRYHDCDKTEGTLVSDSTNVTGEKSSLPMEQLLEEKIQSFVIRDNEKFEDYVKELINMRVRLTKTDHQHTYLTWEQVY